MFTPIRTARIGPGPDADNGARSTRVAGRLLTALASSAAIPAMASRLSSPAPWGSRRRTNPSLRCPEPFHDDAQRQHKDQEGILARRAKPPTVLRRCAIERAPSTTAPASAAHAGRARIRTSRRSQRE